MLKPNRETTLLIIDDEKPIRESLHRTLRQEEYQVRLAENGAQGLRFLQAERIDLAVVDMVLPDWNGVDLLKKIKSEWPEVEVVLVTAYGTIETAVEAMKYGAYDFLTKPFKQAQILNAIKKDGYVLRQDYPERKCVKTWLRMGLLALQVVVQHYLQAFRRVVLPLPSEARLEPEGKRIQGQSI